MTTREAGKPGKPVANPGRHVPRHFIKRVARFLVQRAAVRHNATQRAPFQPFNPEASAKRAARLAPAAGFLAGFLATFKPCHPTAHATLMSAWNDGSLDQALQALRAADPRQAVKMMNLAFEQIREPLEAGDPFAALALTERQRVAHAIRTTRLMMANPAHVPVVPTVGAPALSLVAPFDLQTLLADGKGGAA